MEENRIYLELALGPAIYDEERKYMSHAENLVTFSTYDLLTSDLLTYNDSKNKITYELLGNNSELCIIQMDVDNDIQFITVNNELNSIVIDLSVFIETKLSETLHIYSLNYTRRIKEVNSTSNIPQYSYIYNNENKLKYWEKFISDILRINKTNNWQQVDLKWCTLMSIDRQLKLYIKQCENGHELLGINLDSSKFNYFTDKIIEYNIEDDYTEDKESIATKCNIKINNKEYVIDTNNIIVGTLKLFTNLFSNNRFVRMRDWIEIDNCLFLFDENTETLSMSFTKDKINDITFRNNINNIIKINNIFDKMRILGTNEFIIPPLNNIKIYDYVPSHLDLDSSTLSKYNYTIELKSINKI